jgi:hypothetical protein
MMTSRVRGLIAVALGFVTANARIWQAYAGTPPANVARVPNQRVPPTKNIGPRADAEATGRAQPRPSWPLVTATAVVTIEAAVLAASAVGLAVYQAVGHRPHDTVDSWLVVAFAAVGAGALTQVARGLRRRRRWARSPAVLAQLLTLPVAVNTFGNGVWWVATPLLVCGLLGLVGLFAPSTTHAFVDG